MKYREIGERFEYDGVLLEVCGEKGCDQCYFCNHTEWCTATGARMCSQRERKDKKGIIYKKVDEMKKPIFESEEECVSFINDVIYPYTEYYDYNQIDRAKKKGYIKADPLEEAKRAFETVNMLEEGAIGYIEKCRNYIYELEKKVMELKDE